MRMEVKQAALQGHKTFAVNRSAIERRSFKYSENNELQLLNGRINVRLGHFNCNEGSDVSPEWHFAERRVASVVYEIDRAQHAGDDEMDQQRIKPDEATPKPSRTEVYPALVLHQCNEDWARSEMFNVLHEWAVRFNVQFKLNVPQITLGVDRLRADVGAHFRYGHNAFGLKGEIILNALYLDQPLWWQLGVLLHELLHGWQQAHGTVDFKHFNYHNREFRLKALRLGLIVDRYGFQEYLSESPFVGLLRRHDVEVPDFTAEEDESHAGLSGRAAVTGSAASPKPALLSGNSKLKKWTCGCTNVRVAVADFHAQCLKCGKLFVQQ